jgi:HAD superfamily hydrolase (TIGR01662 family)
VIEAVLFDWDGTLDDGGWSDEVGERATRAALAAIGRADIDVGAVDEWHQRNGDVFKLESTDEIDLAEITRACLRSLGCSATDDELETYMAAWLRPVGDAARLQPDIPRLLAELRSRGLRLGLISNVFAPGRFLTPRLAENGLADAIEVTVFSSDHGKRKPHPAIFEAALAELEVSAEHSLFVGDRPATDIAGASAVGMTTVLATWFREDESGGGADYVAREPLEILDILDRCQTAIRS